MASGDTISGLFLENCRKYGDTKIAMRNKEFGIWRGYTWQDCYERVKHFSLGLKTLGFKHGELVAILGDNEPQWYWSEYAAQAIGGVGMGIFPDAIPSEIKYIIEHSEAKFVVARDQEQVDKILEMKDDLPSLNNVIYWDAKGMQGYDDPFIMSFDAVMRLGAEYEEHHPGIFEEEVEKVKPEDFAVACYTSGTTGLPKGVMMTHKRLVSAHESQSQVIHWAETDEYLSYMSPAWITEQGMGLTGVMISGAVIGFPEKPNTAMADIRELGTGTVLFSSRLWEDLVRLVKSKIADSDPLKRFAYNLLLPVGYKMTELELSHRQVSLFWKALYGVGDLLLFRPLRDKLGLLKAKTCLTGGTMLSPDAFAFLHAIGVELRQIYGITESGGSTLHRIDDIREDTIGPPGVDVELRISAQGELLVRGPQVFAGYYKNPEATNEKLIDGWFHSGDGAYINEDGHVIFLDRIAELMDLAGGEKYAPQYIEGRLKFSSYIKDVMVIGGKDRPFVSAIISIDFGNAGKWAENNHIPYTTYTDLSQKPGVYELIKKDVERVNRTLPPPARIRRYLHLHKEFDPDEAELTRTRKLRREFMEDRYKDLVDALYSDKDELTVEATIKYRDGKQGVARSSVRVATVD